MKALTVQQPWAWAIIHGGKDIENRTQAWAHRGPLAIHAGMRWSSRGAEFGPLQSAYALWLGFERWGGWDGGHTAMPIDPAENERDAELFDLGAIIGVVDLVGAHVAEDGCCESIWAERHYAEHRGRLRRDIVHLELEHPRPLAEPLPIRGSLGLWNTDPGPIYDRLEAA